MNEFQALELLNQACAQAPLTRVAHAQVLEAINIIKAALDKKTDQQVLKKV